MTKFSSEAIGVRAGRQKGGLPTQKERKKEMEQFLKTGVHAASELARARPVIPTLPERDPHRPHVFMDFRVGPKALGRILIEIFEDKVPIAARHFLNRCREGTVDCFQNNKVHRLVQDLGVFGGVSRGHQPSVEVKHNQYLQHIERGTVSISNDGGEYVLGLSRALTLNTTHQVVGRVHKGEDALEHLNGARVDDEQPTPPIILVACGLTNAQGDHESLKEAANKASQVRADPHEQAKQLQEQALRACNATRDALEDALRAKRKADSAPEPAEPSKRVFYGDDLDDELSSSEGNEV